jgi:hypothetical protein
MLRGLMANFLPATLLTHALLGGFISC